jgi:SWI/SNF-related matrix-associated actin-dependent regulator of chromatin subfamily B member 1
VEYHAEESYHVSLKVETDRAKAVNRRRGGAAALRAMNQEATSAPESSTSVINLTSSAVAEQDDGDEDEDKHESKDKPDSLNVSDIVGAPLESTAGAASPADTSSSEEPPLALSKNGATRANGSVASRSALDSAQSQQPPSNSVRAPLSSTPSPPAQEQEQEQEQQPQLQQQPQGQPQQPQSPIVTETIVPSSASSTRPISSSKPSGRVSLLSCACHLCTIADYPS